MDDAFLAYKKEVERSRRVILSMPVINDEMRAAHKFMIEMYDVWITKINDIEIESTKVPTKSKRTRKPATTRKRRS